MITKIDHIAIAVENLAESSEKLKKLLDIEPSEPEIVEEQKVKVVFFDVNGVHIELLEPISEDSPIAGFINKKGPGLHHIAFASSDLDQDLLRLEKEEVRLIDKKPRKGANDKKIAFAHPRSTLKVLMEFCQ